MNNALAMFNSKVETENTTTGFSAAIAAGSSDDTGKSATKAETPTALNANRREVQLLEDELLYTSSPEKRLGILQELCKKSNVGTFFTP